MTVSKEEYLKAQETIEAYERQKILITNALCWVVSRNDHKSMMVFTDGDVANETLEHWGEIVTKAILNPK